MKGCLISFKRLPANAQGMPRAGSTHFSFAALSMVSLSVRSAKRCLAYDVRRYAPPARLASTVRPRRRLLMNPETEESIAVIASVEVEVGPISRRMAAEDEVVRYVVLLLAILILGRDTSEGFASRWP